MASNIQVLILLIGLCAAFFTAGLMWGSEIKEYQIMKKKKVEHIDFTA